MAKKTTFNPIKQDSDGKMAKKVIWSSKALDLAIEGLTQGRRLVANPFYEGNSKLLKGDLVYERTDDEIDEWKKCKNDIIYFSERYCKLMTPEGVQNIKLRDYQKDYLTHLTKHQLSIFLSARQSGKTVTSSIFLLWYLLFNIDKTALVVGNKFKTSREILDKVKSIFYELPFFLKPGIYKWNESDMVFDNGCRVLAEATTINSGIGLTVHCLLCDEFAHVPPNILEPFFNNIFPTVTAGKAKMIITSTQNGLNLFYRIWMGAKQGVSDWAPFEVTWDMVPEWNPEKKCWEKRDEIWHQKQIANYGSEEAFNKQFGTNFDINANTLINPKYLKKIEPQVIQFENKEIPGVEYSDHFFWKPTFEPQTDLRSSHIVITVDISEGLGQDYTTYIINKIIDDVGKIECVGIFRANELSCDICTKILQELVCYHCNQDQTLISIERNLFGDLFISQLESNIEKYSDSCGRFDMDVLVKYYNESGTHYVRGIKITPGNKTKHCILFKNDFERGLIINNSTLFNNEITNFCDNKGNNTYAASFGNDDVVMAQIQLEYVKQTLQWKNLLEDYSSGNVIITDNYYNPYDYINTFAIKTPTYNDGLSRLKKS